MPSPRITHCLVRSLPIGSASRAWLRNCAADGCTKRPSYGLPGGRPTHCAKHKEDGMVDVISPRCAADGCTKHPSFGLPDGRPTHCAKHKDDGMVNVTSKPAKHRWQTSKASA